jgi:uncharacterized membrane protein
MRFRPRARVLQAFKSYLVTGFLIVGPAGISGFLVYWLIVGIDRGLSPIAQAIFNRQVPGLGLASASAVLLGVGFFVSHVGGRNLLDAVEVGLLRIPVFNWVYRTVKQMTEALAPGAGAKFRSVVLLEYPGPGIYSLGFATGRTASGPRDLVAVYVPTNNLYIGNLVLVPRSALTETALTTQQAVQAVLSVGTSLPEVIAPAAPRPEAPRPEVPC